MISRRSILLTPALLLGQKKFVWPNGKTSALSLSFDDARLSQVDAGVPFLNKHEVKATFYVLRNAYEKRLEAWQAAATAGHEIAHHTSSHPCTANYGFSKGNALEDFT